MKNVKWIVSFTLLLVMMAACSPDKRELERALAFAGDNRPELEKVLDHYKGEPEKLEAARFLIRNMPHWYAYEGWQLDSVKQVLIARDFSKESLDKWKEVSFYSLPKVYDAQVISADYLIENIDLAFLEWKKRPWNKSLSFDDFCELILPYRLDNEPLSSWRKLYHDHYSSLLDSLYQGQDVLEACRTVCDELRGKGLYYFTELNIPHLDGVFLFHHPIGYCRESCDITLYAMRACGIPTTTDFFRYSPDYQHYHSWNMLRDTTGRFLVFDFEELPPTRDISATDGRKKGKVYRYCFGTQEQSFPAFDEEDERIPSFFRNFRIKDVTADYFGENEVTVPTQIDDKYIYLSVFSPRGWVAVDVAESKAGKATFRNLEPNIIYQTLACNGKLQAPAGYPFIYKDGKAEMLEPDIVNGEKATLKRKMSIKPRISEWLYRAIVGTRIEAANDLSFAQADLLYEFKDTLTTNYYELASLHSKQKYRYIRYTPSVGVGVELAELGICADTLCRSRIPLQPVTPLQPFDRMGNITDGNILTFFQSTEVSHPLIFRMGRQSAVGKIIFSPRNDDNYIWPGDSYELFYHAGAEDWQSLGVQVAASRELTYYVPKNALLWLRNRTRGREEQVFVYRNGKQMFTIDL